MKLNRFVVRPLAREESGIPDDVDDPVLAKVLLELAYNLASEVRPYGWDQPPALLLLHVRSQVATDNAVGMYVQTQPLPGFAQLVSKYMERNGRMHHAVLHAADGWAHLASMPQFQALDHGTLVATVLVNEGWALMPTTAEQREKLEAVMQAREVHLHPERVEVRMIHLAGRNGLRVFYMEPRDGVPQTIIGQARAGKTTGATGVVGDVPASLHYFMETVEHGRTPGEWSEWWPQFDSDAEGNL